MNYSHFLVRRLMSEQIVDSMAQVTGVPEKFPSMPLGKRAMSIPVLPFVKPHYMMKVSDGMICAKSFASAIPSPASPR